MVFIKQKTHDLFSCANEEKYLFGRKKIAIPIKRVQSQKAFCLLMREKSPGKWTYEA